MNKRNIVRLAALGLGVVTLAGVTSTAAVAAEESQSPIFVYDSNTDEVLPAGHVFRWTDDVFGSPSATEPYEAFTCPEDTTGVYTFIASKGQESTPLAWSAKALSGFDPATLPVKNVIAYTVSPYQQIQGNQQAVKAAGGAYSFGLACTIDNGVNLASSGLWFVPVTITAGSGDFTIDGGETPPVDGSSADIDIEAEVTGAEPGPLSLSVPAGAKATIGNAQLVGGLSTSTGTLPDVTVMDERFDSVTGWTLTSDVVDFTKSDDPASIIEKKQLGMAPKSVSSDAEGVVLGAAQTAGSAVYPATFAEAPEGSGIGTTTVSADLTFVAPTGKPAGTYTSKMTLTLVSK